MELINEPLVSEGNQVLVVPHTSVNPHDVHNKPSETPAIHSETANGLDIKPLILSAKPAESVSSGEVPSVQEDDVSQGEPALQPQALPVDTTKEMASSQYEPAANQDPLSPLPVHTEAARP